MISTRVGIIAACLVLATATAAHATTTTSTTGTVSCTNGTYTKVASTNVVYSAKNYTLTQTSTSPALIGNYHLQNQRTGNNTSAYNVSNGGSVTWNNVGAQSAGDAYFVWHTAYVSTNCNGASLGNGNSDMVGNITY